MQGGVRAGEGGVDEVEREDDEVGLDEAEVDEGDYVRDAGAVGVGLA